MVFHTRKTSETVRLGRRVGEFLAAGDVVALVGGLGTGKTHFIKGLASGLGVRNASRLSSPSYVLVQEVPGRLPLHHIDLYRLAGEKEAEDLGLEEYLGGEGVTVIEWADKIPSLLSGEVLWVRMEYTGRQSRSVQITGRGDRCRRLISALKMEV